MKLFFQDYDFLCNLSSTQKLVYCFLWWYGTIHLGSNTINDLTRNDIADFVGISPATAGSTLAGLTKAGMIETQAHGCNGMAIKLL